MNSSKKYVKFFASGCYFPSYISPLIDGVNNNIIRSSQILTF